MKQLFGKGASLILLAASCLLWLSPAQAVPSYARQTGADCASCHVGGFGPQLTPYGIKFKIGGYTETDGGDGKVPLSAMLVANWTRTAKAASEAPEHFNVNNNTALQEASLFLAGRLTDHVGTFVQSTYSGVDRRSALDQFDIRYARNVSLGEQESTVGLSINGNPTLTDPFNTLGQWRFPYTSSDFNVGFGPTPLIENLAGGVAGANLYGFLGNSVYAEFGLYDRLANKLYGKFNTEPPAALGADPAKFKGMGTYWRLAYFKDLKKENFSVGLVGMNAKLQNQNDPSGTDRYNDIGIDGSYQFLGNREHIYTLNASYMRERQNLDYSSSVGAADNNRNTLNQARIAASYHYQQTWGATVGLFQTHGTGDMTAYGGSLNGKPDSAGYMLQADWTPWGKENSWGAPFANVRLGVQYIGYQKFMGGKTYNDGAVDRNAKDNNTLSVFLWTSL